MKRLFKMLVPAAAALLMTVPFAKAHDFSKTFKDGNTLYFTIIDTAAKTVELTYEGRRFNRQSVRPKGDVVITDFISHEGKIYKVVSISDRAFYRADSLTSITLPKSVTFIGDLAFAKCPALKSVKYGDRQIELGDDVFYGSPAVESVTFGNAWHTIDLIHYRWCSNIKELNVPASVRNITNLKMLTSLESINVEEKNSKFSSADGMLYSKDGLTLYACPINKAGEVTVKEGTESILRDAFKNCFNITALILPSTIRNMEYDELEDLGDLATLVINATIPPRTAMLDGAQVFALRVANPKLEILVPSSAYEVYRSTICSKAGNYSVVNSEETVALEEEGFATKKMIKKIK